MSFTAVPTYAAKAMLVHQSNFGLIAPELKVVAEQQ